MIELPTIKERDPKIALILSFLTFGIYIIYWLYSVGTELKEATWEKYNPGTWIVISIITGRLGFIYMYYKTATMAAGFAEVDKKQLYFILLLLIPPIGIYTIQKTMNKKASEDNLFGPGPDVLETIGFFFLDNWKIIAVATILLMLAWTIL